MGLMSRNKGKTGEREIAALVADLTGLDVKRRVRQRDGDSDLEGVPGWCIEVKRHAIATRASIRQWWTQACEQAARAGADCLPVLLYRQDRDEWRAVWPLAHALTQPHTAAWHGYTWTAEGSIEGWASVVREELHCPNHPAPPTTQGNTP